MTMALTAEKIKESRKAALKKIIGFLDAENIETQFDHLSGDYYSKEKFLVTWNGNYNGMASEFGIHKCDEFYTMYSGGTKCIYATVGLFHEKQLATYSSYERALIDAGLKLCANQSEKEAFFNKYAVRYNNKIKPSEIK